MKVFNLNVKGQNIVEYLLIIAIIALGVVVGTQYIRQYVNDEASVSVHPNAEEYWDNWKKR